jgi:hypothetical protein
MDYFYIFTTDREGTYASHSLSGSTRAEAEDLADRFAKHNDVACRVVEGHPETLVALQGLDLSIPGLSF